MSVTNAIVTMNTRNQITTFALLCALSLAFWWRTLEETFRLALANDAYTHIFLIPPLGAALIYNELRKTAPRSARGGSQSFLLGGILLAVALLLDGYARWGLHAASASVSGDAANNLANAGLNEVRLSLAVFALILWWIGGVVFCFSARVFRRLIFPLCFLFLMVPMPQSALNSMVEFLQYQSALAARLIFRAVGVPATQDGVMVYIPGLNIEVARECSSIRSSLILIVTTMFLAQIFLRTWWRKTLLVALAIPLSVAKNGLRIFTIGELGTRVDPAYLTGKLHHNGGVVFLAISMVCVLAILGILRLSESRLPKPATILAT